MAPQFRHLLPNAAVMMPCRGDPSIPARWNVAEMLADRWNAYGVPVHVVYFGDLDPKGLKIEKSAKADILRWAEELAPAGEFSWTRGGLDAEQVKRFRLPEKVDGKGYQWEALDENQAREIVAAAVEGLIDYDAIEQLEVEEHEITGRFHERIRLFLEDS